MSLRMADGMLTRLAVDGQRKVDPSTYKIVDGRLYPFHEFQRQEPSRWPGTRTKKKLRATADTNWIKKMH